MRRRRFLAGAAAVLSAPAVRASGGADEVARDFVAKLGVPGVVWTVRRASGRVVTGAAGMADPDAGEAMTPDHRLRIASISKPLTAAVVLSLAAEGRLSVTDRPFAEGGAFRGLVPADVPRRDWVEAVTIDHLLTHTAGGWSNRVRDPMFDHASLGHSDLIRTTLAGMALDTAPGTVWDYSNFGYCLLGRVIEAVTGQDVTAEVRARLADPVGAASFALGGDRLADRLPGEAVYVGTEWDPYAIPLARMDSHGGWVMTATDLLAVLAGFDSAGNEVVPDGVPAAMARPWAPGEFYGRGLLVNPAHGNRWHGGALPGLTSFAVMIEGGDLVCALVNGRTDAVQVAIETLVWDIYNAV